MSPRINTHQCGLGYGYSVSILSNGVHKHQSGLLQGVLPTPQVIKAIHGWGQDRSVRVTFHERKTNHRHEHALSRPRRFDASHTWETIPERQPESFYQYPR